MKSLAKVPSNLPFYICLFSACVYMCGCPLWHRCGSLKTPGGCLRSSGLQPSNSGHQDWQQAPHPLSHLTGSKFDFFLSQIVIQMSYTFLFPYQPSPYTYAWFLMECILKIIFYFIAIARNANGTMAIIRWVLKLK